MGVFQNWGLGFRAGSNNRIMVFGYDIGVSLFTETTETVTIIYKVSLLQLW